MLKVLIVMDLLSVGMDRISADLYKTGVISYKCYLFSLSEIFETVRGVKIIEGEGWGGRNENKINNYNSFRFYSAVLNKREGGNIKDFKYQLWIAGVVCYKINTVTRDITLYVKR